MEGYGVNGSAYEGEVTCNLGTFVWDQPTGCTKLPDTTTTTTMKRTTTTRQTTTTEKTTTTTAKPTSNQTGGEMETVTIITIKTKLTITQDFPEGTTEESLMADTGFKDSISGGIAAGLGLPKSKVEILGFTLTGAAGGAAGGDTKGTSSTNSTNSTLRRLG